MTRRIDDDLSGRTDLNEVLHKQVLSQFDTRNMIELIDACFEDEELTRLARCCGIDQYELGRDQTITVIESKAREAESDCISLTRALVKVNFDLTRELKHREVRDVEGFLNGPGASYHEGRVRFAFLASMPTEPVCRTVESATDLQTDDDGNIDDREIETPPQVTEVTETVETQVSRDLAAELDEARRERREILERLDKIMTILEPPLTARPAVARPLESVTVPRGDEADATPERQGPRVALFVDVQSVFYSARNYFGRKMDFKKLIEETAKSRPVEMAVAYVVQSPDVDQTNFITMLQHNGYTVRDKHSTSDAVDATDESPMVVDVLNHIENVDVVIVVGGDDDIYRVCERVRSLEKKQIEFYGFPQGAPGEIMECVDFFCAIDERLLLERENPSRRPYDSRGFAAQRTPRSRGDWGSDDSSSSSWQTDE